MNFNGKNNRKKNIENMETFEIENLYLLLECMQCTMSLYIAENIENSIDIYTILIAQDSASVEFLLQP